tara:strand:+ start:4169 stop:4474 length:306 start_codon:yes stop_codon:yes gene_type:complete
MKSKIEIRELVETGFLDQAYHEYLEEEYPMYCKDDLIEKMCDVDVEEAFIEIYFDRQFKVQGKLLTNYLAFRRHNVPAAAAIYHSRLVLKTVQHFAPSYDT